MARMIQLLDVVRRVGGVGAAENASRACAERRVALDALEARLLTLAPADQRVTKAA